MLAIRPRTWSVGDNDCDRKKQRIEPPDKEQTRKKKLDENNNQTEVRVEGVQQFDLWRRLWVPTSTRKSSLQYNFSGVNSCEFYWFLILSASEKQFRVEIGKKWFRGRLTTPSLKNGFVRTTDLVGSGGGWCGGQKTYHFVATGLACCVFNFGFSLKKNRVRSRIWSMAPSALGPLRIMHDPPW